MVFENFHLLTLPIAFVIYKRVLVQKGYYGSQKLAHSPSYSPASVRLFFFLNLTYNQMDVIITILPVVTKDLPISPQFTFYNFSSRCKFSTRTTRQPMVEFYLLTFPRFPLRKKEHKSYFGKNRTHDFRTTSRCADYLLDHSGDDYRGEYYRL